MGLAIDTVQADNPDTDLLGPFYSTDTNVEPLLIRKTIYLPAPFLRFFLKRNLTPVEARTCLRSAIADIGLEVHCRPIINWLRVALTLNTGNDKSPLAMPRPTAPLSDGDPLCHWHHMLTRHLPRLDPDLQKVQGLIIATQIGEVAV